MRRIARRPYFATMPTLVLCFARLITVTTARIELRAQKLAPADSVGTTGPVSVTKEANQQKTGRNTQSVRYTIQPQDTLAVSFTFSPELNETVTVQPDGFISLLSARGIYAQGLNAAELIANIKKAYVGILENPEVTVDLKDVRHPFFTVIGEVNKPGKYDLREDLTVTQALSVAGGIEPSATSQVFLLHRDSDAWYRVEKLNMKDVLTGKKTSQDQVLKAGDMIYVPEKFIVSFKKYVPYSFNLGTYFQLANVP